MAGEPVAGVRNRRRHRLTGRADRLDTGAPWLSTAPLPEQSSGGGAGGLIALVHPCGRRWTMRWPFHAPFRSGSMEPPFSPLVLLHTDEVIRRRVQNLARSRWTFQSAWTWGELDVLVRRGSSSTLVIVDPYHGQPPRGPPAPALETIRMKYPSTAVLAALPARAASLDDARLMGAWGVARVIKLGPDVSDACILQALTEAKCATASAAILEAAFGHDVPPKTQLLVAAAQRVSIARGTVADLRRVLGVETQPLLRWCQEIGLPPPKRLLMWMRLLVAARLLDDLGRRVVDVAYSVGYSSEDMLASALRTNAGMGPLALRRRGAWITVVTAFQEEIACWATCKMALRHF